MKQYFFLIPFLIVYGTIFSGEIMSRSEKHTVQYNNYLYEMSLNYNLQNNLENKEILRDFINNIFAPLVSGKTVSEGQFDRLDPFTQEIILSLKCKTVPHENDIKIYSENGANELFIQQPKTGQKIINLLDFSDRFNAMVKQFSAKKNGTLLEGDNSSDEKIEESFGSDSDGESEQRKEYSAEIMNFSCKDISYRIELEHKPSYTAMLPDLYEKILKPIMQKKTAMSEDDFQNLEGAFGNLDDATKQFFLSLNPSKNDDYYTSCCSRERDRLLIFQYVVEQGPLDFSIITKSLQTLIKKLRADPKYEILMEEYNLLDINDEDDIEERSIEKEEEDIDKNQPTSSKISIAAFLLSAAIFGTLYFLNTLPADTVIITKPETFDTSDIIPYDEKQNISKQT